MRDGSSDGEQKRTPATAAAFEQALRSLAGVRALVMGTPLRKHLTALAEGTAAEAPLEAVAHRTGEHYFVKPGADAVTLVRNPIHIRSCRSEV